MNEVAFSGDDRSIDEVKEEEKQDDLYNISNFSI
jgi:hypothetical protein